MTRITKPISFTKMEGAGNDYIYIDCTGSPEPERLPELSREMSDRHFGVGGDGIVLITPSETADLRMRIFNADGSEARMCGNASRCIALYAFNHGLVTKSTPSINLETLSGVKVLMINRDADGEFADVTVDMGKPVMECPQIPVRCELPQMKDEPVETVSAGTVRLTAVSMGNPHGVIFEPALLKDEAFFAAGPELENHPMWPDRANIEFVEQLGDADLRMRVWERGSGETLACGTGACATAVAAWATGRCPRDKEVTVRLRGGDLKIRLDEHGHVLMTGPAREVFSGTYTRKS